MFILFPIILLSTTDSKDGNGLKFEKVEPTFSSFDNTVSPQKIPKILLWVGLFKNISLDINLKVYQEHSVHK